LATGLNAFFGFWVWDATTLVEAVTALAAAGNVAFLLQTSRTERNLAARPLLWARVDEEPDGVYLTLDQRWRLMACSHVRDAEMPAPER
jgi:hypothetical protein